LNDTAIGVQVSMRINYWSWSSSRSGNRGASAGAATRITTSSSVAAGLALENLSEQTARTLASTDTAIATSSGTAARIASSDFSTARRTTSEQAFSATTGDFSAAAWASTASTSDFSSAAWTSNFGSAAWSCSNARSMLSSQTCVEVSSSVVDLVHLFHMSCVQLALEAFEAIENWGAADRSWSATGGFNTAAWSNYTTVVTSTCIASSNFASAARTTLAEKTATGLASPDTCTDSGTGTWIASRSSDFGSAAWATSATSHFGSAARINNRGITARALGSDAVSTQQTMDQVATEALSAKACSQNHRSNKNVPLHLIKLPMYTGSLTTTDISQHDGVEADFGVRSRRRNRPLLARLKDLRKAVICVTS